MKKIVVFSYKIMDSKGYVNEIYKITHHWEWSWFSAKPTALHLK